MKFNMQIMISQAENGFVLMVNSMGASKQFIAKDFADMQAQLKAIVDAIAAP